MKSCRRAQCYELCCRESERRLMRLMDGVARNGSAACHCDTWLRAGNHITFQVGNLEGFSLRPDELSPLAVDLYWPPGVGTFA